MTPRDRVEVSERDYYPGTAPQAERRRERGGDARAEAAPRYEGKPLWSASRRYSAEENARRHFERNGEAIGARSYDDFLDRVRSPVGLCLGARNHEEIAVAIVGELISVRRLGQDAAQAWRDRRKTTKPSPLEALEALDASDDADPHDVAAESA